MKSTFKNTILSLCAIGLLAGCASKGDVDNKMDQISGEETAVSDETSNTSTKSEASVPTNVNSSNGAFSGDGTFNGEGNTYNVYSDLNGEAVSLESVHFAYDKFNLTDSMREIATSNYSEIDKVAVNNENLKIKLEGNCDEWGSDEYNYALGLKRAKSTKDALVADGVDASKIVMVSFGESNPICNEKNKSCWKMNRRVDYRLLP